MDRPTIRIFRASATSQLTQRAIKSPYRALSPLQLAPRRPTFEKKPSSHSVTRAFAEKENAFYGTRAPSDLLYERCWIAVHRRDTSGDTTTHARQTCRAATGFHATVRVLSRHQSFTKQHPATPINKKYLASLLVSASAGSNRLPLPTGGRRRHHAMLSNAGDLAVLKAQGARGIVVDAGAATASAGHKIGASVHLSLNLKRVALFARNDQGALHLRRAVSAGGRIACL